MKNPKYALVIGEAQRDEYGREDREMWQNFLLNTQQRMPQNIVIERFHDNVWLIDLETSMRALSVLIELSVGRNVRMRVLFLEESPDWLTHPPVAKPAAEAKPS